MWNWSLKEGMRSKSPLILEGPKEFGFIVKDGYPLLGRTCAIFFLEGPRGMLELLVDNDLHVLKFVGILDEWSRVAANHLSSSE